MELWIRSQDRTALIKIDELNIGKSGSFWVIKDKNPKNILGSYDSFDRTLEVLDEIQNILNPKYILDASSIIPDGDSWVENGIIMQNYNANASIEELSTYVYQMPEN